MDPLIPGQNPNTNTNPPLSPTPPTIPPRPPMPQPPSPQPPAPNTPLRSPSFEGQAWPMPKPGNVPPPPPIPQPLVRTMGSDNAAMKANPGAEPRPNMATPASPSSWHAPFPAAAVPPAELPALEAPGSPLLKTFGWLVALAAITGIGWAAYEYAWPMIFGQMAQQPAAEAPTDPSLAPPPPASQPATSMFGTPLESIANVTIGATPEEIIAAISAEATARPAGNFKEISIKNAADPMPFSSFVGNLMGGAKGSAITAAFANAFEPNFGAYVFYDDKGAWPGYVAKINYASGMDIVTITNQIQTLESSEYQNFFVSPPGESGPFRTGQVQGKYVNRFAPFPNGGSFNYGIFGDYLIINTSYGGLLKALELLRL